MAADEDARLFQVWHGSLAVSTNILEKLDALDARSVGEAAGAVTGLLNGAAAAAADLEARQHANRRDLGASLKMVSELRALTETQRAALAEKRRCAASTASRGVEAALETDAERDLRGRCVALTDANAATKEAARISRVVGEMLERRCTRAEAAAEAAQRLAEQERGRRRSLERVIDHLEALLAAADERVDAEDAACGGGVGD